RVVADITNNMSLRKTGIKVVGDMPWGSHLCQFYHTKRDLLEILLPYFKAGLKNNEFCMWVTSEPLGTKEAKGALKKEVKNLDRLIKKGQIEILDYSQWYTKGGRFNADRVLAGWVEKEQQALKKGFSGLRLTGNTFWLEKADWENFTEYEAKVNNTIGGRRMLAICTYSLDRCSASQVIDVVNNHQFALIKRKGRWTSVESSSYRTAINNLEEMNRRYQLLIDNIRLHIAVIDKTGKFTVWNKYSEDLFGYTKSEAIGKLKPGDIHISRTDAARVIRGAKEKGIFDDEVKLRRKNGSLVDVHLVVVPNKDHKGNVINYHGFGENITERKHAERFLRQSHHGLEKRVQERTRELKQLNKALEAAKDNLNRAQQVAHIGSWYLDIADNALAWSDETYHIFGLNIGSPLDYAKFLEIVHPEDREYVNISWQNALRQGFYDIEHRIVVAGRIKWVRESAQVEFDKRGKAIRGIGTVQDITEQKEHEKNTRKLQQELTHVSRVTTMGELTAALAHELNQPLMAIMSNAQAAQRFLAKSNPDINEIKEILSDIVKDDKRASDVINKLRALIRKSDIEFTILNINDVVNEVVSLVHSDIVIRSITLNTELSDKNLFVNGDRIQLQQVILNLILNSFEATKDVDSKRVRIRTAKENDESIVVSFEDAGTGIDEENLSRIFEPFFTTKKEGMGMGLAINKVIIESHGGTLWAENNPDKGATFYFTLPISKECSK
ncbi:MAG: MEDS domain-containing protein, partial [Candidatus Omnitrophica bacterium]|nr:MEDS domain-containing protein [Candidatus Omnitrophota bacterium]